MPKYEVEIPIRFIFFTTVEADTEAEAAEIAHDRTPVNMDHYGLLYRYAGDAEVTLVDPA